MSAPTARHRPSGLVFALASALAFGGSGVFARPLLDAGMDSLHVTWLRLAGAALILLPVAARHWRVAQRKPLLVLAYGVFPMAGVQALYFAAIARIPVGIALLLEFLGPVLVLLWVRVVRRNQVSPAAVVGVVLAVAGLGLLLEVWAGMRLDAIGVGLALGAAAAQAAFFLLGDAMGEDTDPLAVIAFGALIATALLGVLAQPWTLPWGLLADPLPLGALALPGWMIALWLGLVCTAIAYFTGVSAIKKLSPQVAGGVAYLEVVTAIVLAWVLLGEALTPVQVLGAAVIVTGAFIAQTAVPRTPETAVLPATEQPAPNGNQPALERS
ncbi:EamA family transporter [Nocardiopsis metallicus]|uniref:Drug/metabolite transporter (DMT)-like permease n=1 Tax=Nocardiopsis metallicus TaxID=179819 RepID=A0A840W352_9ACTN|nr:EamA family transporter [Nocardiopsis metallicus]MBB5490404.1 drug/metabolite transporter (DMT)-like permease [Nocardiopsis metallicus]